MLTEVPAAGLLVLIGAEPFMDWLPGAVGRDQWGYFLMGGDAAGAERRDAGTSAARSLERASMPLGTSVPGVFAVGDVQHG